MSGNHDAVFLRVFLFVLGGLVAFTFIIMIAARFIGDSLDQTLSDDPLRMAAIERNVAPVGQVRLVGEDAPTTQQPAKAAAVTKPLTGAEVYQKTCIACHGTGAAGAPKVGDKAAWQPRVGVGIDGLVKIATTGKGAMPPRGGNPALSDEEIRGAIEHMLHETGIQIGSTAAGGSAATQPPAATTPAASAAPVKDQAAAATPDLAHGKKIFDSTCFACHLAGVAGAPKLGDAAAWQPRIAQGKQTLLSTALHGKGAMPPKGGRADLSTDDVAAAIDYMVGKVQ